MPGFDGTGPLGRGPLTGRGLGPCGRGLAFRRGFGGRRWTGRGFGFRRTYYAPVEPAPLTKEEEKMILEDEMKLLEQDAESIKKRLKELGK